MSLVLNKDHEFYKNVLEAVDESLVIGAVDAVPFVSGGDEGSAPIAVLNATVLNDEVEALAGYVVLHQGTDVVLATKEQIEAILSLL